jgi:hypothetical protein
MKIAAHAIERAQQHGQISGRIDRTGRELLAPASGASVN